ncbi:hypothetical protein J7E49_06750 [Variovorax paradoxus]|nr:hypothetical protein [Variovorax paradoxus]
MSFPNTWRDGIDIACDPEIFAQALQTWSEAADQPLAPAGSKRGPGLYLTDIPINRSGLATTAFLKRAGVTAPQAYLWRVMHFFEVLEAAAAHGLSDHVREDEISCALVSAAAAANMHFGDGPVFDMEDVNRRVREFEAMEVTAGAALRKGGVE